VSNSPCRLRTSRTPDVIRYSTDDVRRLLDATKTPRDRALVHFVASSGIRARGVEDLKLKHLKKMPNGCKCVTVYAGTKDEYYTFITYEASEALDKYFEFREIKGETLNSESLVFKVSPKYVSILFSDLVKRSTIQRIKVHKNRYNKMCTHALRKRFNTILKNNQNINLSLAERLMGHSKTIRLDNSYFDPNLDDLFSEYQKAIPELLVDEVTKLKIDNEKKARTILKLESDKDFRITNLEQMIAELSKRFASKI